VVLVLSRNLVDEERGPRTQTHLDWWTSFIARAAPCSPGARPTAPTACTALTESLAEARALAAEDPYTSMGTGRWKCWTGPRAARSAWRADAAELEARWRGGGAGA